MDVGRLNRDEEEVLKLLATDADLFPGRFKAYESAMAHLGISDVETIAAMVEYFARNGMIDKIDRTPGEDDLAAWRFRPAKAALPAARQIERYHADWLAEAARWARRNPAYVALIVLVAAFAVLLFVIL